jgi:amino acid transporter
MVVRRLARGTAGRAALVVVYFLFNFWSVKVFAGANSAITFFKLIVPAGTAIALMCSGFHWENFQLGVHGGPHVGNVASILTAVATSGIVFSYNGFQSPVNLAGEAHNPGHSVPIAIFGSIALSTVVYLMLQVAFLGAVSPDRLHEGWAALEYSSPFAQLALALNLNWLAILLYADAFVSPSGTGVTYTATTARMIYAMERNGTAPEVFGRVHPRFGIPRPAMWFNIVVSPAIEGARPEYIGATGLCARDPDALLGALAAHGGDHAVVDSADTGLLVLPGQGRMA